MLPRYLGTDEKLDIAWDELGQGAATILALARMCGRSFCENAPSELELNDHAKALLVASKTRGILEIRGKNDAFDSADRLLFVAAEQEPDQWLQFKQVHDPRETIRYLEAFRTLCQGGWVIHHLFREFSLSSKGFELADQIQPEDVQKMLDFASLG